MSVTAEIPLSAALMVWIASDISSLRIARSLARWVCPWAAKKLMGSSSAEFTFFPVLRRVWVVSIMVWKSAAG